MTGIGDNRLAALAGDIKAAHQDVARGALAVAERALEAGRMLNEAKSLVSHGEWAPWLATHTGLSARTARRYMQLTNSGVKAATVADLGIRAAIESLGGRDRLLDQAIDAAIFFLSWARVDPTPQDVVDFLCAPDLPRFCEQIIAICEKRITELAALEGAA